MRGCDLITEQRMNGIFCSLVSCEPCREFKELNDEYMIKKKKEELQYKEIKKLKEELRREREMVNKYEKVISYYEPLISTEILEVHTEAREIQKQREIEL